MKGYPATIQRHRVVAGGLLGFVAMCAAACGTDEESSSLGIARSAVEEGAEAGSCGLDCEALASSVFEACVGFGAEEERCRASSEAQIEACRSGCEPADVSDEPTADERATEHVPPAEACFFACREDASISILACLEAGFDEATCVGSGQAQMDACVEGCASPATGADTDVYRGFFCGEGQFIETRGITLDDALANCELNAAGNPERRLFCTFNDEVIYDACDDVDTSGSAAAPCDGWQAIAFDRASDGLSAGTAALPGSASDAVFGAPGEEFVRLDRRYGLWVGLVAYDDGYRFYLSESAEGPFLPATDYGGHGQDFCELLDPGFALPNEDDITSGGCTDCAIGINVSVVGVEVFTRGQLGQPFERRLASEWGADQTSVIRCASGPLECLGDERVY